MVEADLKQWLNSEEEPGDFYRLVGLPRLCQDALSLQTRIEAASEYLFEYQNHKDKAIRDRARSFQRQVAEARHIVSDRSRWEQYDRDLIEGLRKLCRENPNFSGQTPKLDDLKRWLAYALHVDRNRVDEIVPLIIAEPKTKKPRVRPASVSDTVSNQAAPTQDLRNLRPSLPVSLPEPATNNRRSASPPPPSLPVGLGSKRDVPPPPPVRESQPEPEFPPLLPPLHTKKSPPKEPVQTNESLTLGTMSRSGSWGRNSGTSPRNNVPVVWIVLGVVSAMVLMILCLAIAWASGAFDKKRSRAALPSLERRVVDRDEAGLDERHFLITKT